MKDALPISLRDLSNKTIGWPDYSNAVSISISRTTGYTVPANGWISANCSGGSASTTKVMYVNGIPVAQSKTYSDDWMYAQFTMFPVSKGDEVTVSYSDSPGYFIPCK